MDLAESKVRPPYGGVMQQPLFQSNFIRGFTGMFAMSVLSGVGWLVFETPPLSEICVDSEDSVVEWQRANEQFASPISC